MAANLLLPLQMTDKLPLGPNSCRKTCKLHERVAGDVLWIGSGVVVLAVVVAKRARRWWDLWWWWWLGW